MKHLYLFRHGKSLTNIPGGYWANGPKTIPLTKDGENDAKTLADNWQIKPDILVSSPYVRSVQTLEPFIHKFKVPAITLPVQEFTFWNLNMTLAEYQSRQVAVKSYWDQLDTLAKKGIGAESFDEFLLRVLSFKNWASITPYQICLCCSHGFYMHAFRAVMNGTKFSSSRELMQYLRDTLNHSSYANLAVEHYTFESEKEDV